MSDFARARKLADVIKVVVANVLDKKVRDPRLGFVTVTDVRVTNDLQQATVFYTVLGDDSKRLSSALALESAKGMLRTEVGKNVTVRLVPTLEFVADALPENAEHISDLLRVAKQLDADVAKQREGASYAGEADPYSVSGLGEEKVE